jgi:O-acetyl-ADP-ribose deacetylase (regulator of RNase III)
MIHYIKDGDIFSIEGVTNFAHGCNCAGSMGSGIAVQFRKKFPRMYENYRHMCLNKTFRPGDVYDYYHGNGHVYNLATQQHYCIAGYLAKLEYIETSMEKMMRLAEKSGVQSIAMPKIGARLGGLNWVEVKAIIEKVAASHSRVDLYVVENYSPAKYIVKDQTKRR